MIEQRNQVRILVVEDEPQLRSALRLGLEADGYSASQAGSEAANGAR